MDTILTRRFLDTCHIAKHLLNCLPPLPVWMTPRQIKVIDTLHQLQETQDTIRISDIASSMSGTLPSITRMVNELEKHDVMSKRPCNTDKRAHSLSLTPYGEELYEYYVKDFHTHIAQLFEEIDDEDMITTINVISRAKELLEASDLS